MKEQKNYNLEEAIKKFYTIEPLKTDLAKTVADKVFAKRKKVDFAFDNRLYIFITILIAAGIIYSFSFLKQFSLLIVLLAIISIIIYCSLSFKEYWLISKRLAL